MTLVITAALLAINLLLFPLARNVQMMALFSPFGGFVSLGFSTAMLNGVLGATPDENRLVYMAFYNTAISLSLFLAPLFSHFILSITGIYAVFFIYTGMRLFSAGVLYLTQKKGEIVSTG